VLRKSNNSFGKAFFFKERFIGTIIGMLFGFVSRVIIVRLHHPNRILNLLFSTRYNKHLCYNIHSGLQEGSIRYIAYHRGKGEEGEVRGVISSSIKSLLLQAFHSQSSLFHLGFYAFTNISFLICGA